MVSPYHLPAQIADMRSRFQLCRENRPSSLPARAAFRWLTMFNNCFVNQSPSLFSYFYNYFLAAQGSDLLFFSRERGSKNDNTILTSVDNLWHTYQLPLGKILV